MTQRDPDELVVLASTPTAFHADTIVMTLHNAGIEAKAVNVGSSMTFMGTGVGGAKVMVRREDLARARQTLKDVEQQSASIDWDAEDVGDPSETPPMPLSKRSAWTIVLLILAPITFIAAMSGQLRGDPLLSGLATTTLIVGMIIAGWMIFGGGGKADGDDAD